MAIVISTVIAFSMYSTPIYIFTFGIHISTVIGFYVFNSVSRGYMVGGGRCIHVCTSWRVVCLSCRECWVCNACTYVTVLAWDGRSYLGRFTQKERHIYKNTCMVISSGIFRPDCVLAAAATCPWLFCISTDQCIGGMSKVSVSRHRGVLQVFLGLWLAVQKEEGSFSCIWGHVLLPEWAEGLHFLILCPVYGALWTDEGCWILCWFVPTRFEELCL